MHFVIHVGPHKTGTTYIQNHLTSHREYLCQRGINYPAEWLTINQHCHVGLEDALRAGDAAAVSEPLERIAAQGTGRVVISSEGLSTLGENALVILRDAISGHGELRVVFYIRRWSELIPSQAQESIRHGGTLTLAEYCSSVLLSPFASAGVNYAIVLDRLSRVFGEESLNIISYNNVLDAGKDLYLHFLASVLDVSGAGEFPPLGNRAHESLSADNIEILRVMNVLSRIHQPDSPQSSRGKWVRQITSAPLLELRQLMQAYVETISIKDALPPFSQIYSDIQTRYAKNLLNPGDDSEKSLFNRGARQAMYIRPDYLAREGVAVQLENLFWEVVSGGTLIGRSSSNTRAAPAVESPAANECRELSFGREGNASLYQGSGWSSPERGFTWMIGLESELWLENPGSRNGYILEFDCRAFVAPPLIPAQRLTVAIRGVEVGSATVNSGWCELTFHVPSRLLEASGPLRLSFSHPDAIRPIDSGHPTDQRQLSIAMRCLRLRSAVDSIGEAQSSGVESVQPDTVMSGEECDQGIAIAVGEDWASAANGSLDGILGNGWGGSEEWGVWGIGPVHELKLYLDRAPTHTLKLEAEVTAALVGTRVEQAVDVHAAGKKIATWVFSTEQNRAERSVLIPPGALTNTASGALLVRLEFRPHSVAPINVLEPGNRDDRALGLALYRLRITQEGEAESDNRDGDVSKAASPEEAVAPLPDSADSAPEVAAAAAGAMAIGANPGEPAPTGEVPEVESEVKAARKPRVDEPELPTNELLTRFESLGENCEFGLVQRRGGAEPLGLFRFSSAPLSKLLAALQNRLEGFGAYEDLSVELSSNGREYMVRDRRYGFLYHAWVLADEMEPNAIRAQEARRLPLLIRKLIEDLTGGRKLLVVHGMDQPLELDDVTRLLFALRRFGPNSLLWVALADWQHPAGLVEWAAPNLLKGYIDRFAPGENAHDLSLDCWLLICRTAHQLWQNAKAREVPLVSVEPPNPSRYTKSSHL